MGCTSLLALSLLGAVLTTGCARQRADTTAGAARAKRSAPQAGGDDCAAGALRACTQQALLELRRVGPLNFHGFSLLEHACEGGDGPACFHLAELESAASPEREFNFRYERACRLGQGPGCMAFAAEHLGARRPDELTAAAFFAHACKLGHAAGCSEASRLLARWRGVHALELLPLSLSWRGAESHHSRLQAWVLEGRAAIIGDPRGLGLIDARMGERVGPIIPWNGSDASIRELRGVGMLMWSRTGHGTLDAWLTARTDGGADARSTLELPGLDVCEVLGLSQDGRRIAVRLQPRYRATECPEGPDAGRVQGFRLPDWQPDADAAGLPLYAGEHDARELRLRDEAALRSTRPPALRVAKLEASIRLVTATGLGPEIAAGTVTSLLLAPDGKSALAWSEAGGLLRLWFEPATEPAGATELAVPEWWGRLQPMPPPAVAAPSRPVEPRPLPAAVRRGRVRGSVRFEGRPLARAAVRLLARDVDGTPFALEPRATASDARGRFAFEDVPQIPLRLEISAAAEPRALPRVHDLREQELAEEIAVDLQPAATLLGRVLDATGSSARTELRLARADLDAPARALQADGVFRFAGLEPGRPYWLTGLRADGAFASAHVTLQPGENRHDLQLLAPTSPELLRLRARTAGGRPLREASVLSDGLRQLSDAAGLIVTDRPPPGGRVSVLHPEWTQSVVVVRDPGTLLEAVFPDASITVRPSRGRARDGREIALVADADPARLRPASDTAQTRFEQLSAGRYELYVVRAAEGLFGSAVIELSGGDAVVIDEPPLRRGVAFEGVVLESASGAPLVGAVVTAPCLMLGSAPARARLMGAGTCRATTDAAGRFRLVVAPGRRHLTIERAGFGKTAREVEVPLESGAPPPRFSVACGDTLSGLAFTLETRSERDGLRVVSVPAGFDALLANDVIDRIDGDEATSPSRLFNALQSASVTMLRVRRPVTARSLSELLLLPQRHRVLGRTRDALTLEVALERERPVCDQRWLTRALSAGRGPASRDAR